MNNTYGNVKPSLVNPVNDVEIFYHYTPTRNSEDVTYKDFHRITDVTSVFSNSEMFEEDIRPDESPDPIIPGMYKLSLPVSIFGRVGFYTVYIRPKEIYCVIKDVGSLAAYPDIQGIILDVNEITANKGLFGNDNLTGYRVEYLNVDDSNKLRRQEYYRLITGCGFAEPVTQNLTSANTNSNGYRFNESGTLSFITLTPSTSPSYKLNSKPFIGTPNQRIIISNTKFDPVCINIEICENDIDTVTTLLDGNQIRSLDNGLLTTYNKNNEIFTQHEFYTLKDNYTQNDKFEVKVKRTDNIDTSVNQNEVFNV